ncbi:MAG: hypothetical protein WC139_12890 [Candidatus Kapaibacterium sp.]
MKPLIDMITDEMNLTKELIIKSYKDKGLKASGKFERDLEVVITESGSLIKAKLLGSYHSYFMQYGRRPNSDQSLSQARGLGKILEQWVKDKGISVNPYAAAWKIVHEGIKVPNSYNPGGVVSDVANETWLKGISDRLISRQTELIRSEILKIWQQ